MLDFNDAPTGQRVDLAAQRDDLRAELLARLPSVLMALFPAGRVRGKVFVFLSGDDRGLGLSVKLPTSNEEALRLPGASPTGYGLGRSGWVSFRYAPDEAPPVDVLTRYIRESYGAVAPRKLAKLLA